MAQEQYLSALSSLNFSAAVKALDNLLKSQLNEGTDPKDRNLRQLYYNRGLCYQKLELHRKALKDFDAALEAGASATKTYFRRGQVQYALGKEEHAKKSWRKALQGASVEDDGDVVWSISAALADPGSCLAGLKDAQIKNPTAGGAAKNSNAPIPGGTGSGGQDPPSTSKNSTSDFSKARDLVKIMQPQEAVGVAVEKVNAGKCEEAEEILNEVILKHPSELGAWVARGTARALMRKLEDAVQDFSAAINVFPQYPDTWKRRGQAKSALGDNQGALEDLQKCIDLLKTPKEKAEAMIEKSMVLQKLKDFRKAVVELEQVSKLNDGIVQAWNLLGLCKTSLGDIQEGVASYKKALAIDPNHKESWFNMCQALKEAGFVKEAEQAYRKGREAERRKGGAKHIGAYRVMASMHQGMGQHKKAIQFLDEALSQQENDQDLECCFLRAACYHATGRHEEALKDYMRCLEFEKRITAEDGLDRHQLVVLAFYQKELALYARHKLDVPISTFCLDRDISPVFKELWCKKVGPTSRLISSYTLQQPIPASLPAPPPPPPRDSVQALINLADQIGSLLQNHHQGFLPNKRQQRAAGLAVIELAQAVRLDVQARKNGEQGLQVDASGASGGKEKSGFYPFGWRDAMDIIVKWRQLSEPNDQVVWVDLLTPSEFAAGFGSHTPMFSGQTKCVRYYMNFERAFKKQKEILLKCGKAFNAQNEAIMVDSPQQQEAIRNAKVAGDMYAVIKEDAWVVVPIQSLAQPDAEMEGTRLTLVNVPNQPDGYEFSIRTPVTPARWDLFEADLSLAWGKVISNLSAGDPVLSARSILTFVYYWYNFMPLARGTAASGHATLLALFWAAGMPVTRGIPPNYQIDWEAILEQHPNIFANELCQWMVPDVGRPQHLRGATKKGAEDSGIKFPDPMEVPRVSEILATMRDRIEALNGPDAPRI
ncbi:hypothetical protein BSKO_03768 [Bryopsis sp. KO-2023]|nr:hypothetical protein BSKO_03768 [Bryopsis sp. KO-2023]